MHSPNYQTQPQGSIAKLKAPALALLIVFLSSLFSFVISPQSIQAALPDGTPEKLAFYYGKPSLVNGANGDTTVATDTFKAYDIVVFANEIDSPTHVEHEATEIIINNLISHSTRSYGYVDLCWDGGIYCTSLPMEEIKAKTDRWAAMGVAGIFLDQVGYDYTVSRDRLNEAVDYIHSKGLSAFVNPWNPDDVFSPDVHPTLNPAGTPTHLGPDDYVLHESFAVTLSDYQDPAFLIEKSEKALQWKRIYGTKMATVNTTATSNPPFDQAKFEYVWWMTFLYGYDAMAWGETWVYSSDTNSLPFHPRPEPGDIGSAIDPLTITHSGAIHRRSTTTGYVEVDTTTHVGQFVEGTPPPPPSSQNFVTQPGSQPTDLIAGEASFVSNQATFSLQSNGAPINAYRLFLDRDKNTATGFLFWQNTGVGGDYMVENGYLYEFAGATQTDWSWAFVGPVTATGAGSLRVQVTVSFGQIGYNAGTQMAVLAEHFDPSTFASYDVLLRSPGVWVVQSSAKQAANEISQAGNADTDLIAGKATFNSSQLTLAIQSNGAPIHAYRIFLDSDISEATGFVHSGNSDLGSEYLIENGSLYQFAGATQTEWNWTPVGAVTTDGLGTSDVQVTLDFSQINYLGGNNLAVLTEHFNATTYASYDLLLRAPGVWVIEFLSNEAQQAGTLDTDLIEGNTVFHSGRGEITFKFRTKRAPINFYRVFLDVDANKGTGFLHFQNANVGSEYLIENGSLYQFTGTAQFEWNWTLVGPLTADELGTRKMKVTVPYSQIGYLSGEKLGILVENVNSADYSMLDMLFRSPGVWLVQSPAELSRNEVAQLGNTEADLIAGNVGFVSDQIIFTLKSNGAPINAYRIFVDRDKKKNTGFRHNSNTNVGSEYLIENGNLYQFTGATQTEWSWTPVGPVTATGVGGSKIQVTVPFSQIGYVAGEKMALLVEHIDPSSFASLDVLLRSPEIWKVK